MRRGRGRGRAKTPRGVTGQHPRERFFASLGQRRTVTVCGFWTRCVILPWNPASERGMADGEPPTSPLLHAQRLSKAVGKRLTALADTDFDAMYSENKRRAESGSLLHRIVHCLVSLPLALHVQCGVTGFPFSCRQGEERKGCGIAARPGWHCAMMQSCGASSSFHTCAARKQLPQCFRLGLESLW